MSRDFNPLLPTTRMAAIDPQRVIHAVVQSNPILALLHDGEIEGTGINTSNMPSDWSPLLSQWSIKDLFPDVKHPDMLEDPVRWEEGWRKELEETWANPGGSYGDPSKSITDSPAALVEEFYVNDEAISNMQELTRVLCTCQQDLARHITNRITWDSFDAQWGFLKPEERAELVLTGICRAMYAPMLHEGRPMCPDSTLEHLTSENGETFLKYLRMLLPDDPSEILAEPKFIPHPDVDRYLALSPEYAAKPGFKTTVWGNRLTRGRCMTRILGEIFFAFYKLPMLESEHFRQRMSKEVNREKANRVFRLAASTGRAPGEVAQRMWDYRMNTPRMCHHCGKSEDKDLGVKFSGCGRCLREAERRIFYCSRACQVADWKYGVPRPHKDMCGRPLTEDMLRPATAEDIIGAEAREEQEPAPFPDPEPSFKRSPALDRQIEALHRHEDCDYVIFESSRCPHPVAVRCDFFPYAKNFYRARHDAFKSGNTTAVQKLYQWICYLTGVYPDISRSAIRRQLEAEYRVSLGAVYLDWIKYDDDERDMAEDWRIVWPIELEQ